MCTVIEIHVLFGKYPFSSMNHHELTCLFCIQTSTYCDCTGTTGAGTFTGVIIDGVVPTIDTSQMNWATQLLTVRGNAQNIRIGFKFQNATMFRPSWGIGGSLGGTNTINI